LPDEGAILPPTIAAAALAAALVSISGALPDVADVDADFALPDDFFAGLDGVAAAAAGASAFFLAMVAGPFLLTARIVAEGEREESRTPKHHPPKSKICLIVSGWRVDDVVLP
jgi:hypothetical protein